MALLGHEKFLSIHLFIIHTISDALPETPGLRVPPVMIAFCKDCQTQVIKRQTPYS
jgi:hypothetical protein